MKIITDSESSLTVSAEREAIRDVKEKRCASYSMIRHPSLLFEHPMKNLTARGYSLFFVLFIRECVGMSFQPLSTGTVASGFRDTCFSSAKYGIRKVFVHQCRAVRWMAMFQGAGKRLFMEVTKSAPSSMNIKVVAPPDDVGKAEQIVADACDSFNSCSSSPRTSGGD